MKAWSLLWVRRYLVRSGHLGHVADGVRSILVVVWDDFGLKR